MSTRAFRLPGHVRPSRYDVHLTADVDRETFDGDVAITLGLTQDDDTIVLHGRDLDVTDATLDDRETGAVAVDAESETITISFHTPVSAGEHVLRLRYTGKVSRNMEGLYLSADGDERCLASQCEETDARAIFPCFDEPEFKARLAWTVTTNAAHTVLTNGATEAVEENEDGTRTWRFAPTPPMSTYLAAVSVGPFAATAERTVNGVPFQVWTMKGKEGLGGFGQDFAVRLLPWFEDYFATPYHFGKYDQLAVPSFSAGAMENPGLVLFRQNLLLMDPKTASRRQEKLIAKVVAHEFAHMWFGDLVTMRWWDDLWLNEAFAEWMAHKAVDALAPEYEVWLDFHGDKRRALATDALSTTHPIYNPVETPEQATELFDAITYQKGCAVMRMLEGYLGEDAFREGLRTYMHEFSEDNASGHDLWRHLAGASSEPVADVMESWITQPGFPVVRATYDEDAGRLHLTQRRFFSTPDAPADTRVWRVPLVIRYADDAGEHEVRHLLTSTEGDVDVPTQGRLKWLTLNAREMGFYRQDLDDDLLHRLATHMDVLDPAERLGLLDDQWALVRNGSRPMERFLDVLDGLTGSRHHILVEGVVGRLHGLEDMVRDAGDADALAGFQRFVADRFAPRLAHVGSEPHAGEDLNETLVRPLLFSAVAGLAEKEDAIATARTLADREADDPASVDPNLAGTAVNLAAHFGDGDRHARHVRLYAARRDAKRAPQEVQRYLYSLAAFRGDAEVRATLDLLKDGTLPKEAWGPILRLMLGETHAQRQAWTWLKEHWGEVRGHLGDMWTGFLVEATGALPADLRDDMVAFYDANLHGVALQARARALEALDQRAEFRARVTPELLAWCRGQST